MDAVDTQDLAMSFWAALTLFAYDILITLDAELQFVWRQGRWSVPKMLYVVARYIGFAASASNAIVSWQDHSNNFCDPYNSVFMLLVCIISASSDGLLLLRVCAMYGPAGRVTKLKFLSLQRFLLTAYGALVIYEVAIVCWLFKASVKFAPDEDNFGCSTLIGLPGSILSSIMLAILAFNSLLLILSLAKVIPTWWEGNAGSLSRLLMRDGSIYFAQISATSIASVIMMLGVSRPDIQSAALPWYFVMTPIAICRLFLNLKATAVPVASPSTDSSESDFSLQSKLHWLPQVIVIDHSGDALRAHTRAGEEPDASEVIELACMEE